MAEQKERAVKSIFPRRVQRSYKPPVAPLQVFQAQVTDIVYPT